MLNETCRTLFIISLMITAQLANSAVVEVRLDGRLLPNATLFDCSNQHTTDALGVLVHEGSCLSLRYVDENEKAFRSMNRCGFNEADRLYRVNLSKEVTLSGTAEFPHAGGAELIFSNLDEGVDLHRGIGSSNPGTHNFSEELPAGRYRIKVKSSTDSGPASEFFLSSVGADARSTSVSGLKIGTEHSTISRWQSNPPRADLITVRHLDSSHLSLIEGASGAAEPLVRIGLVNLQTGQTGFGASEADGSFSIRFFAPPGAALQISQDRHAESYNDFSSKQPATVVHVPLTEAAFTISTGQRLNGSSQNGMSDLEFKGAKDPGTAWLTGTLDSSDWLAGDTGTLRGKVDIYSRNLKYGAVPSLGGGTAMLELLFNENGEQKAAQPQYSASDLTVTGLPIERASNQDAEAIIIGQFSLTNYESVGTGHGRADWSLVYKVPDETPDGIYQLILTGQGWSMNPWVSGLASERLYYEDVYGEPSFHLTEVHGAARITIGEVQTPRLYSAILLNEVSNGSRGTTAVEDVGKFGFSGHWITNADKLILPKSTREGGRVKKYNIEPFTPLTAYSNKEWLNPPKLPLEFPTGQLSASIVSPSGVQLDVGPHTIKGAYVQQATSELGEALFRNSNNTDMVYGLTTHSEDFVLTLDEYGEYRVTLEGFVKDIFGQKLEIAGSYSIYIAELMGLETGVFPGTPFEVGDKYAPTVIIQPGLPATVTVSISHFPNSSPEARVSKSFIGDANRFGYFATDEQAFRFSEAGEYRVNYDATYTAPNGTLWMASRKWASVVETPGSNIISHGSRGDEGGQETKQWYFMEDSRDQNAHFFSPFQIGDVMWMDNSTEWNAAMQNIVTLDDGGGQLTDLINTDNAYSNGLGSGSLLLRPDSGGDVPPFVDPSQPNIHWAYYYSSIGRPGISVREFVGTESTTNGYWRFNTPYGYQMGSGYEGDQPNDFKFVFGGAVYRVPDSGFSHFGAYGSLWTMLPESDQQGGRVMPPFQGAAGGPSGGPLFELKGKQIDIFLHPQGVRPGSILELGDVVSFSGQVAPTLPSQVQVEITAPSGTRRAFGGVANKVGYFFDPANDYVVEEPGVHTVEVTVIHDGMTSAGPVEPPYPSGSILGATNDSFKFYVTSAGTLQAKISSTVPATLPQSAKLALQLESGSEKPVAGMEYTAVMPGFILDQRTLSESNAVYDAFELHKSFPNLDLPSGELQRRNGSDTVTLSFLTHRADGAGSTVFEGRQVLLQGEQILAPAHLKKLTGTFRIQLLNSDLSPGERLNASVEFDVKGDADLYIAVFLPDGNFVTVDQTLNISEIGELIPFSDSIPLDERLSLLLFDIALDEGVASGTYRLIALVTAAGEDPADESKWLGFDEATFTFTK
ncbi:MAG: hypothetical protein CMQ45_00290 [Gammaproteobacteria bacterium]|nr:hypothetical protein [Gammaproteobacteria bacterium]